MSAHEFHERTGAADEPILFDGCERCAEHAELGGLDLDVPTYAKAWQRMIEVERGDASYRSENEAKLGRRLYVIAVVMERNMGLDPWRWPPRPVLS